MRGAIARRLFEESLRRHRGAVYIQKHARRLAACRACHTRVEKIVKLQSGIHPIFHRVFCFSEGDNKVLSRIFNFAKDVNKNLDWSLSL